ncbi:hypothetical protein [Pectobacterium phage MA14]|nr:hypothetical protein [Pectobacterium phage MA14]
MSGILLTADGLDLSKWANGMVFPYMETCEYMNVLTQGVDLTRNLAPGKPKGRVVGTPVGGSGFVTLSQNNYIQTEVPHGDNYTVFTVARQGSAELMLVSNYGSPRTDGLATGNTQGMSFMMRPSGGSGSLVSIQFVRKADGTSTGDELNQANLGLPLADVGKFKLQFQTLRGPSAGNRFITNWDATAGMISSTRPLNSTVNAKGSALRVGAGYSFGSNSVDIAFVAIWNRQMSDPELLAVRDFARAAVAGNGITA